MVLSDHKSRVVTKLFVADFNNPRFQWWLCGNFLAYPSISHTHCSVKFAAQFSGLQQVWPGCSRLWVAWGHWWWLACQLIQQGRLASCLGRAVVIDYSANHPKSPPSCPAHCQAAVNKHKSLSGPTCRGGTTGPWALTDLTAKQRRTHTCRRQAWQLTGHLLRN